MNESQKPQVDYPNRIPLKVLGRAEELDPVRISELIRAHLGPQEGGEAPHHTHHKGAWTSYTFWVVLPDDQAERPLREAIQALPGVVGQM